MRRSVIPLLIGFLLLLIAFVYLAQAAFIVQLIGVVDRVEGKAEIQRQGRGRWVRLKEEMFVQTQDLVRTQADSRVEVRWLDGTRLRVEPDTVLQITKNSMNTLNKRRHSQFDLQLGKIWFRIIEVLRSDSKFEVKTPTSTACVRGTIFSVEVDKDGVTKVSVYDGKVAVETPGRETSVGPGLNAVVPSPESPAEVGNQTSADLERWKQQTGIITPALTVRYPDGDMETTTPRIEVRGTVEPTATLTVNDAAVKQKATQKDQFSHTLTLTRGENVIRVRAADAQGNSTEVVRRVTLRGTDSARPMSPPPAR